MQVAMLGSLEVRADRGEVLEVGGARLRALLIMLALRPGRLVPASELIDGLWADAAPAGAPNALQALFSRLRRALPEAVIESRPAGYRLNLDPGSTDIVRFEELAAQGRAQLREDPAAAAATLRQALALWRGPALVEVAETEFGRAAVARLDELRLSATEHRIHADLRSGPPAALVAELEGLVIAHPMRKPLAALAGQRTLLLLDNCEHLVASAADLADRVLAACPQVRIMATSREPLNITGEALWTVGPLTLPPDPAVSSFDLTERSVVLPPGQVSTPSGELLTAVVTALTPPPFQPDIDLLVEALQLAAQRQQAEARQKIAVGVLGGAALAIALGSSRS